MNCETTLEQLDCVRPHSDDLALPEFADARAHLELCDACRSEFERRQRIDSAIANVMHEVTVPDDQPVKLLAQLETAAVAPGANGTRSKRATLWRAVALSLSLGLLVAVAMWPRTSDQLAVDEVLTRLSIDVTKLSRYDGKVAPPKPFEWSAISVLGDVRGQDLDGTPGHDAAVRLFQFDSRRGHIVQGLLITLPAQRVSPAPAASRFNVASPRYPSIGEQRFAAVAWQEGDWVYICLIPDNPGDLELLQRSTQGMAA